TVIGGAGHVWGAVAGAAGFTILKQWRQDSLPGILGQTGNFEVIVFGVLMVLVLHRARAGLWPALRRLTNVRSNRRLAVRAADVLPRRPMPKRGEVVLQARDVTRRFGGLVANNRMSLEVHAGEILGLIGPNGAGKSTMFNQISGGDTPTSGEVLFLGQSITGKESRYIAGMGMSRTFQHVRLIPRMTVLENVAIGTHLRGSRGVLSAACRLDRAEE